MKLLLLISMFIQTWGGMYYAKLVIKKGKLSIKLLYLVPELVTLTHPVIPLKRYTEFDIGISNPHYGPI